MARIKPPAIKVATPTINDDTEMSYTWNAKLSGETLKKFQKIRGTKKNSEAVRSIILDFFNRLPKDKVQEYYRIYKTANEEAHIDISVYDRVLKNI